MLDHVSIGVRNSNEADAFLRCGVASLGIVRTLDFEHRGSDYGSMPDTVRRVGVHDYAGVGGFSPLRGMHVCFRAPESGAVRASMAAALRRGSDDGAPGPRLYIIRYCAAFVIDPDGHP